MTNEFFKSNDDNKKEKRKTRLVKSQFIFLFITSLINFVIKSRISNFMRNVKLISLARIDFRFFNDFTPISQAFSTGFGMVFLLSGT